MLMKILDKILMASGRWFESAGRNHKRCFGLGGQGDISALSLFISLNTTTSVSCLSSTIRSVIDLKIQRLRRL